MIGLDTFYEAPGTVAEHVCQICGAVCFVERNRIGPTGWAAAMIKSEILHDYFYCPHRELPWHVKALELVRAIERTPSKRVATLMQLDLVDLLSENGCKKPE